MLKLNIIMSFNPLQTAVIWIERYNIFFFNFTRRFEKEYANIHPGGEGDLGSYQVNQKISSRVLGNISETTGEGYFYTYAPLQQSCWSFFYCSLAIKIARTKLSTLSQFCGLDIMKLTIDSGFKSAIACRSFFHFGQWKKVCSGVSFFPQNTHRSLSLI